jgi:hypothetical protein
VSPFILCRCKSLYLYVVGQVKYIDMGCEIREMQIKLPNLLPDHNAVVF